MARAVAFPALVVVALALAGPVLAAAVAAVGPYYESVDSSPAWPSPFGGGGGAPALDPEEEDDRIPLPPPLVGLATAARAFLPLPPPPAAGRARALLDATTTVKGARTTTSAAAVAAAAAAAAAAPDYKTFDYAYMVAAVTPRKEGTAGACPKSGGARGARGQRLASLLARSLRGDPRFADLSLRPLQCWERAGVFEQASDVPGQPLHAFWVLEARKVAWSGPIGEAMLAGDAACSAGPRIPGTGTEGGARPNPIPRMLRVWCGAQNRAGRQALRLATVYLTRAAEGVPPCKDGLWNGAESGVDCGAACKNSCLLGEGCGKSGDCPDKSGCDRAHRQKNKPEADGTFSLGGLGTCAQKCADYTCPGGAGGDLVADARYASLFCDTQTGTGACTGKTYSKSKDTGAPFDCCASTLPCSDIKTCAATPTPTYADPDLKNRCSDTKCDGKDDRAKYCLAKAPCSGSVFSDAVCAKADAASAFESSAFCSKGACNATLAADQAACCPKRASTLPCSDIKTCAATQYADPDLKNRCSDTKCGADDQKKCCLAKAPCSGSVFSDAVCAKADAASAFDSSAFCSTGACNATLAADQAACCPKRASCASGYFGAAPPGPLECPAASNPVTAAGALCAGRACSAAQDGAANCCAPVPKRTCLQFQQSDGGACASPANLGAFIPSPEGTSCYSDLNCRALCCTGAGALVNCFDVKKSSAGLCGSNGFRSTPRFEQCTVGVGAWAGSCLEACCKP